MKIDIGNYALLLSWILALWAIVVGTWSALKSNHAAYLSARQAVHLCAIFSFISLIALGVAFVRHDYTNLYVWQHSNNAMHPMYLVSAIWGGMDGSMLLWAAVLAGYCSLALRSTTASRRLLYWAVPVFGFASGFFLTIVALLTNPFRLVPGTPTLLDGNGLNPLLQNPSMMIHPPMLYLGFTGFVVPFAFSMAALLSGELSDAWIRLTRRWTLISWAFLSAGIILGGNWAYIELGWGGFWAWDPVENASFFPWLTATAYLHSVMVQEQRGMLKVWNICLSVATYGLTVFGTFLTRSGIVQSVHAFAETDVGWVFLLYLAILATLAISLLVWRWNELRPENQLQSYISREAAFLFNNLVLLGICFATLWGVMFPVLSEAVTGEKSVVGPPFFNKVNTPLFLALLFLMGVGPVIAWRRASWKQIVRLFSKPFVSGCVLTAFFLWIDPSRFYTAVSFGLCLFVIMTIEADVRRALRVQRASSPSAGLGVAKLVRRKPRRVGGFLVHFGVAIMAVAITAASAYKIERDITLRAGENAEVGRFSLELKELKERIAAGYDAVDAIVLVRDARSGAELGTLLPERRIYRKSGEVTTEVALRITPRDDLYIALTGLEMPKEQAKDINQLSAVFKVFVNPLQVWLWFGSLIMLLGAVLVIIPSLERVTQVSPSAEGASARARV